MRNQHLSTQLSGGREPYADLMARFGKARRLQAEDKPIFAKNLGALAARVFPDDPLEGARLIVNHSGNESLWPTKRKKYFRLPGEEAPPAGKGGAYASNPAQFRKLAEAAGELLCKNTKPEAIESSRQQCVRAMFKGTSFMPVYVPADPSAQSAKNLLDEYAAAVGEAIESRTRISDLWEVLRYAPIGLEVFSDDIFEHAEPSPYGEIANFPSSLLQPSYRPHITHGRLSPSDNALDYEWSSPLLHIGSVAHERSIRLFCIPPEKQSLFPPSLWSHRQLAPKAVDWMATVGFDVQDPNFPPLEMGSTECGWKEAKAALLQNVCLGVEYTDDDKLGLELHFFGDWPFAIHLGKDAGFSLMENAELVTNRGMTQHMTCKVDEYFSVDVIFNAPFDPANPGDVHAIGLLPDGWQYDVLDDVEVKDFVWMEEGGLEELNLHDREHGWTDDEYIAKFLLGDAGVFIPALPDAEPVGGVLPAGSIGAALLQNARVAQGVNRISQLLIDRAALTAETGLRFYEAMVEDYRSAIRRI